MAIIDDHAIIHDGITGWVADATAPAIGVVGTYENIEQFDLGDSSADVIVLDLQFGTGAPQLASVADLCKRGLRVIVFSQHTASHIVMECLDLGAVTYLSKAEGRVHMLAAIQAAGTDQPYLSPTMAKAIAADDSTKRPDLSEREKEVLISWFQTESKELVGKRLFITEGTVKTHLGRIRTKYANVGRSAPTKAALVARAIQDGLITVDEL
ncbi:response regulator transcription factor [Gordonia asplenii]|uniref:response regulator transcription factor n=1 Tax=Gordonia asplenii TaxID=2725283 RepID=UPI0028AFF4D0|nr:response regulator transcription factor [Gordonia asplenii]